MPFISVITINRNNASGLKKTLKSVCSQDSNAFECVVIDGDSIDGSQHVVEDFKTCVTTFLSEKDHGIYDAMNKGIQRAKGEYVIFINSGDCFADESVLSKMKVQCRGEDLLSGDILFEEATGIRQDYTPEKLRKFYLLHSMLYHPVTFMKRNLFDRFGMYDDQLKIVGDYEFFLRILSKTKISYKHLPFNVALFDNSGISASPGTREKMLEERLRVQQKYFSPFMLLAWRMYKSV